MIIQYLVYQGKKSIKGQEQELALFKANYIKALGKVYNIQEASKKLKETPDRIKLMMKRGIMSFIQIDDDVFITKKVIADFLANRKRWKELEITKI